jgi:hypothetical protein
MPAWLRSRPRPAPSLRFRRRFHEPRWAEGPQTVWRPPFKGQAGPRPRFAAKLRRGRYAQPPWPQVIITTPPPRWIESGGGGSAPEGGGGSGTTLEGGGGGTALTEGGGSGGGQIESGSGSPSGIEGGGAL